MRGLKLRCSNGGDDEWGKGGPYYLPCSPRASRAFLNNVASPTVSNTTLTSLPPVFSLIWRLRSSLRFIAAGCSLLDVSRGIAPTCRMSCTAAEPTAPEDPNKVAHDQSRDAQLIFQRRFLEKGAKKRKIHTQHEHNFILLHLRSLNHSCCRQEGNPARGRLGEAEIGRHLQQTSGRHNDILGMTSIPLKAMGPTCAPHIPTEEFWLPLDDGAGKISTRRARESRLGEFTLNIGNVGWIDGRGADTDQAVKGRQFGHGEGGEFQDLAGRAG